MLFVRLDAGIGYAISLPALVLVGLFVGFVAGMFGMGTDNKGNRIAFGTATTDYGLMQGEYWAARTGKQGTFTHI